LQGAAMPQIVEFFFLMLAAGEVLKKQRFVNAQKIQDYIQSDDTFGVRVPLPQCRLALQLLEDSGFVIKDVNSETDYERATLLMVADKWK
jgi:hypothetical protein